MEKKIAIVAVTFILILVNLVGAVKGAGISEKGVEYDNEITEKFANQSMNKTSEEKNLVSVMIRMKDFSDISVQKSDSINTQKQKDEERWSIYKGTSESVLSTLSENEFILERKSDFGVFFSGNITEEGFNKLLNDGRVEKINIKKGGYLHLAQSAPLINADNAWSSGYSGVGQTVCVIDTGVDYTRGDLGGCFGGTCKVAGGYDYVVPDSDPIDEYGHGTNVAGIVASSDSTNTGIAPDARLVALRACPGGATCDEDDVADSLLWCYNNRNTYNISVVTMSLGFDNGDGQCGTNWANPEIDLLYNAGITLIASSGNNDDEDEIHYPACNDKVIAVGATYDFGNGSQEVDWCKEVNGGTLLFGACWLGELGILPFSCADYPAVDNIACFTNRGPELDLLAPGCWITASGPAYCGTSQAAPHVAGAVALLRQKKSDLTPLSVKNILQTTGDSVGSWKRIDVDAALDSIPTACSCSSWSFSGGCGTGGCNSQQRPQTRSCTPDVCQSETQCVYDESCVGGEGNTTGNGNSCTESGYYQCYEYNFGDCDVRLAANWYDDVPNDISWGAVNDNWDPYVIGQYNIGWTGVDAQQMYYDVDNPDEDCTQDIGGQRYCQGGCDGIEIANTGTRTTVTAPGVAHTERVLAYDDTPNYCCWAYFNSFYPGYINDPDIYVLNCFNDTDCSASQYCNKAGSWSTWSCVNKKSNGQSCTLDSQCSSGYCDNDGVGLTDDGWCFSPYNTYFDGQETNYCEVSTNNGINDCDEKQAGTDLNKCIGVAYYEEECSSTCNYLDVNTTFECGETGCSCSQPLCDGLTANTNITTCSDEETYFADKCTSSANGQDRNDSICRSSTFASSCTASSQCNGVIVGTGNCNSSCQYVTDSPPTTTLNGPTNNSILNQSNVVFNCSETDDKNLANITLYGNWSGGWHANETKLVSGVSNSTTFTKMLGNGSYKWNCLSYDNASQSDWANSNWTFIINLTQQQPSPSINLNLIYPTTSINTTKNQFFNVTLNVTCKNADCGEINVSLDPEPVTTYTKSSDTICNGNTCTTTLYSGIRNVFEDGEWKKIEDARSLKNKNFEIKYLDSDDDYKLNVLDFNYTSIQFELEISNNKLNQNIPIRLWEVNDSKLSNENIVKNSYKDYSDIKINNNVKQSSAKKVYTSNFGLGKILEIGGNSTTITLQDADTENLNDVYTSYNSPDTNYDGDYLSLLQYSHSFARDSWIMFNLSSLQSGNEILDAVFSWMYYSLTQNTTNELHACFNPCSWTEENLTWNSRPSYNQTAYNVTNQSQSSGNRYNFNATGLVKETFSGGYNNVTLVIRNLNIAGSRDYYSKEMGTVLQRPYLNITYTTGGVPEGIKGLINSTIGAVPFYTNQSNPRAINLSVNQSQLVTFWVNATGNNGTYEFFAFANKTSNPSISNITSRWNVTITETSQQQPLIDVTNLSQLYWNEQKQRTFGFFIKNIGNSTLSNVAWKVNTGDNLTTYSQFNSTLVINESKYVVFEYNYTTSGSYTVNATAWAQGTSDSQSMQIGV
ncbi:MAG: S8 family serine peptidase [Nanoarchaeota archaeon]